MNEIDSPRWRRELFEQYAADRRTAQVPGYTREVAADITRHLPQGDDDEALLWLARFRKDHADERIREELANLRVHGWEAEWKVQDLDQPADLKERLERFGLRAHHEEALMILDVERAEARTVSDAEIEVKEASPEVLDGIVQVGEEVWNCKLPWLAHALREMTHPERGSAVVYCARTKERVIGSGWIEFHGGSRFAQLCGGSILERYRGRGVYSRLFEQRLTLAKERGVPFITVDAAPMSRPILERRGFRFVCHTYGMRTRAHELLAMQG